MNGNPNVLYLKARKVTLLVTVIFFIVGVVEMTIGIKTNLISVFSDGVDSVIDSGISVVVMIGLQAVTKPGSGLDGHARIENLMSLFAALLMLGTGLFIGYLSYIRLITNVAVSFSVIGFAAVVASGVVSLVFALLMIHVAMITSLNSLKTNALNASKDVFSAFIVSVMLLFVRAGLHLMDAVGGLVVAGIICFFSYVVIHQEAMVLIDVFDNPALIQRIQHELTSLNGFKILEMTPRKSGPYIMVNMLVSAKPETTLLEIGAMKIEIESAISDIMPSVKSVVIDFRPELS